MRLPPIRRFTTIALLATGGTIFLGTHAGALEIIVQNAPVLAGTGSNLSARFANVATVEGRQIDLFAEIVSQSQSGVTHGFYKFGDDFGFLLNPSELEETRMATVRYSFLDGATSYPATLPVFALTISDLDGYNLRTDSVASADSVGYILNDPSNVVATVSGTEVSFAGTRNQFGFTPQPEAAVNLRFATRSTFSIHYTSDNKAPLPADFTHDGNGDLGFSSPVYTSSPKRLYYTFSYDNQSGAPIEMKFEDKLPAGLLWDTEYVPETVGYLGELLVSYSSNAHSAFVIGQRMPTGFSSFKLRTQPTQLTGEIVNEAKMKFAYSQLDQSQLATGGTSSAPVTDTPVQRRALIADKTVSSTVTIIDYAPSSSP